MTHVKPFAGSYIRYLGAGHNFSTAVSEGPQRLWRHSAHVCSLCTPLAEKFHLTVSLCL